MGKNFGPRMGNYRKKYGSPGRLHWYEYWHKKRFFRRYGHNCY